MFCNLSTPARTRYRIYMYIPHIIQYTYSIVVFAVAGVWLLLLRCCNAMQWPRRSKMQTFLDTSLNSFACDAAESATRENQGKCEETRREMRHGWGVGKTHTVTRVPKCPRTPLKTLRKLHSKLKGVLMRRAPDSVPKCVYFRGCFRAKWAWLGMPFARVLHEWALHPPHTHTR